MGIYEDGLPRERVALKMGVKLNGTEAMAGPRRAVKASVLNKDIFRKFVEESVVDGKKGSCIAGSCSPYVALIYTLDRAFATVGLGA